MKKFVTLALAATMVLSLAACGEKPAASTPAPPAVQTSAPAVPSTAPAADPTEAPAEELTLVTLSANGLTFAVPSDFQEPVDNEGVLSFAGPDASIVVMPALPADFAFDAWTEEEALAVFGASYTNVELMAFNNEVIVSDAPTFMLLFTGENANGVKFEVTALGIYPDEATMQVAIFTYLADTETSLSVNMPDIMDSIALG